MTTLQYEIVCGKRRTSKLLYIPEEKQFYIKKSTSDNKTYYVCYVKNCKARVTLDLGRHVCTRSPLFVPHNHTTQKELYDELKVLNNIKKECLDEESVLGERNALSGIRKTFESSCDRYDICNYNILLFS